MTKSIVLPTGKVLFWDESKWGNEVPASYDFDLCDTMLDPSLTIDELGLSVRLYNVLMRYNVKFLTFFEELNVEDLKSLRHFPDSGIEELKQRFSEHLGIEILKGVN